MPKTLEDKSALFLFVFAASNLFIAGDMLAGKAGAMAAVGLVALVRAAIFKIEAIIREHLPRFTVTPSQTRPGQRTNA